MPTIGSAHGPFFALLIVAALVLADWLLGILAALRTGTFHAEALPRQLATTVLPYIGALSVVWGLQWLAVNYALQGSAAAGAVTLFSYFSDATVVPKTLADIGAKLGLIASPPPPGPAPIAGPVNAAPIQ